MGILGNALGSISGRQFLSIQQRGCNGRPTGSRTRARATHHLRKHRKRTRLNVQLWIRKDGKDGMDRKYLHVKKESLDKAERFMAGRGAWMGFFAFLPLLGSAITIVLGLTRANLPISIFSITIGKVLRYVLLVYGLSFIF